MLENRSSCKHVSDVRQSAMRRHRAGCLSGFVTKESRLLHIDAFSSASQPHPALEGVLEKLHRVLANGTLIIKALRPLEELPRLDRAVLYWEAEAEAHRYIAALLHVPAEGRKSVTR